MWETTSLTVGMLWGWLLGFGIVFPSVYSQIRVGLYCVHYPMEPSPKAGTADRELATEPNWFISALFEQNTTAAFAQCRKPADKKFALKSFISTLMLPRNPVRYLG